MNIKLLLAKDRKLTADLQGKPASLRWVMLFITFCGSPVVTVGLLLLAAMITLNSGQLRLTVNFLFACVAMLIGVMFKILLRRNRPKTVFADNMKFKTYSFPSGHSFGAVISYGYLTHILLQNGVSPWLIAPTTLLITLIGYSRIYLGAHFVLDVLGGWLVGSVLLLLLIVGVG